MTFSSSGGGESKKHRRLMKLYSLTVHAHNRKILAHFLNLYAFGVTLRTYVDVDRLLRIADKAADGRVLRKIYVYSVIVPVLLNTLIFHGFSSFIFLRAADRFGGG